MRKALQTLRGKVIFAAIGVAASTLVVLVTTDAYEWSKRQLPGANDPVAIRVETDPKVFLADLPYRWATFDYVIPASPKQLSAPADLCHHRQRWAREQGGVDARQSVVRVYVEGKDDKNAVVMKPPRVKVVARRPPLRGTHAACAAGGPVIHFRKLLVDLDKRTPMTAYTDMDGTPLQEPYEWVLRKGDVEAFEIAASTKRCDCEWTIDLKYTVDGEGHTYTVTNHGKPFRTTGTKRARTYVFDGKRWRRSPGL